MSVDHLAGARFQGAGIVVLGAGGGGIGTATPLALAGADAQLLCVDSSEEQATAIAAETGGIPHVADITDRAQMKAVFARAAESFGDRFAGVVDVVGMARNGPVEDADDAMIDRQFAIVLRHAILAIQIAAPMLAARGGGAMTFIGSMSADRVVDGQTLYGMAKAAQHHLVRYAAQAFGPAGVRANVVSPSFVETPRLRAALPDAVWQQIGRENPLRRPALPEDVAKAVLFLTSSLASYINGQVLTLDGGLGNALTFPGTDIPLGR